MYNGNTRLTLPVSWQEILKDEEHIVIKFKEFCFLVKNNSKGRLTIPKSYIDFLDIEETTDVLLELESVVNKTVKVHLLHDIQV